MPCTGGHAVDYVRDKADSAAEAANKLTAMLCKLVQSLPQEIVENLDPEIKDWAEEHKKFDEQQGRKWGGAAKNSDFVKIATDNLKK